MDVLAERIRACPPDVQVRIIEMIYGFDKPAETVVLIPEVRAVANLEGKCKRAHKLTGKMEPRMSELGALVTEIRDSYDETLLALAAGGVPTGYDDIHQIVGDLTGWDDVWSAVSRLVEHVAVDGVKLSRLRASEAKRGARDHKRGAKALIETVGGEKVEMEVFSPCTDKGDDYRMLPTDQALRAAMPDGTTYVVSHDEIAAGLIT